ncbi:MAG: type I restriction enzyme HsdR N-terminal domain-containing protein [Abitibacteriaceae bacterium]|nr:type I restriction enzyme HsdR N-terminal domain-containing protein [Abditibacteriaceae bacterium]MBV9865068.1 type I restriction enzyme HsdR N-terminal domain-containing protein [Abditibacteriaceae bacterium]
MFDSFDFNILDNPEFKEDSVREEIILPILHELGYSATGQHQITRSKALLHPFVMIGSKKHPIHIIPDYLLKVNGSYGFVLDAKAPSESIYKSANVEQVYSYAIHPDVRVNTYALCNGREFAVYDLFNIEPLLRFDVANIEDNWLKLQNILSPSAMLNPEKRDFIPDFGILATKAGYTPHIDWYFFQNEVSFIMKANDNLYTVSSGIEEGESEYFISLDFTPDMFNELLKFAPGQTQLEIRKKLSCYPYQVQLDEPFEVGIEAHLGELQTGEHEQFIPMIVTKVMAPIDLSVLTTMQ